MKTLVFSLCFRNSFLMLTEIRVLVFRSLPSTIVRIAVIKSFRYWITWFPLHTRRCLCIVLRASNTSQTFYISEWHPEESDLKRMNVSRLHIFSSVPRIYNKDRSRDSNVGSQVAWYAYWMVSVGCKSFVFPWIYRRTKASFVPFCSWTVNKGFSDFGFITVLYASLFHADFLEFRKTPWHSSILSSTCHIRNSSMSLLN